MRIQSIDQLTIGNGGGCVKGYNDVERMCRSVATRVIAGSATLERRDGNIPSHGTLYIHPRELWALNSLGLPNMGMNAWEHALPAMLRLTDMQGKEFGLNIAGETPAEYAELTARALKCGVRTIQANFSCWNRWGPEGHKALPASNPEIVEAILREMSDSIPPGIVPRIEAKVAPDHDSTLISDLCSVFAVSGIVTHVITANAEGNNRRLREDGSEALSFRYDDSDPEIKHVGALSGTPLTAKTPLLVEAYTTRLPPTIGVIAAGGIFDGSSAFECIKCGAVGIESTTSVIQLGPTNTFNRIVQELVELMEPVSS